MTAARTPTSTRSASSPPATTSKITLRRLAGKYSLVVESLTKPPWRALRHRPPRVPRRCVRPPRRPLRREHAERRAENVDDQAVRCRSVDCLPSQDIRHGPSRVVRRIGARRGAPRSVPARIRHTVQRCPDDNPTPAASLALSLAPLAGLPEARAPLKVLFLGDQGHHPRRPRGAAHPGHGRPGHRGHLHRGHAADLNPRPWPSTTP